MTNLLALELPLAAHVPLDERKLIIDDLVSRARNESGTDAATFLLQLLEVWEEQGRQSQIEDIVLDRVHKAQYDDAARISAASARMYQWALEHHTSQIAQNVQSLRVPENTNLSAQSYHADDDDMSNDQSHDTTRHALLILRQSLTCLSLLYGAYPPPQSVQWPSALIPQILLILQSEHQDMNDPAKGALLAYTNLYKPSMKVEEVTSVPGYEEYDGLIWPFCNQMLRTAIKPLSRTIALQVWLRWLIFLPDRANVKNMISSSIYWWHIRHALAHGDVEQGKLCLQIMRISLPLAVKYNSMAGVRNVLELAITCSDHHLLGEFERYCTVYETINIGRYLNQSQACIRDLDAMVSNHCIVPASWLFALLCPALSMYMQDSVQKLIGDWILDADFVLETQDIEMCIYMLTDRLLPWALQGTLFASSLKGDIPDVVCVHGERLTGFLTRLLHQTCAQSLNDAGLKIIHVVLDMVHMQWRSMLPHALSYVLEGLIHGTKNRTDLKLDDAHAEVILEMAVGTGFPPTVCDLVALQCNALLQNCFSSTGNGTGDHDLVLARKLSMLSERVSRPRDDRHPADYDHKANDEFNSVEMLVQRINDTNCGCLQGARLLEVCDMLSGPHGLLSTTDASCSDVLRVSETIKFETEVQDYPRRVLMVLPGVLLHPTCVRHVPENEDLATLLSDFLDEYIRLCAGRIYLWSPLIIAVRRALISQPYIARYLRVEDLLCHIADAPPEAKIDVKCEAAAARTMASYGDGHPKYKDHYGHAEGPGYAAYFDLLNVLHTVDIAMPGRLFDRLLLPWVQQLTKRNKISKWKTSEQLQVMVITLEQALSTASMPAADAQGYMSKILSIIETEPLPRYRFLFEWTVTRIVMHHPQIMAHLVALLGTNDHHSNPKYLTSVTKLVTAIVCLHTAKEDMARQVMTRLVVLSSSSKVTIRHEAQWSLPRIWDHAVRQEWTSVTSDVAVRDLVDYIKSQDRYIEPMPQRELERFDPLEDHSMSNLLSGAYIQLAPAGSRVVTQQDFDVLYAQDKVDGLLGDRKACIPRGRAVTQKVLKTETKAGIVDGPVDAEAQIEARLERLALGALQTKGSAYLSVDNILAKPEQVSTKSIIVVGSLIESNINLGGLSRASDVFGATALYVAHRDRVLLSKEFTSLSVSSHNHLPIHNLLVEDMSSFLMSKKRDGYTIVGCEQTDRSVMLGHADTLLPDKTVLVLGAEREGIPALVLGDCDLLVEIPQSGVTRSLNVQTAAACVLYEYCRQHRQV